MEVLGHRIERFPQFVEFAPLRVADINTVRELAMCELFCVESGRRFREARQGLDAKDEEVDDRRRAVAAAVRKAQGYFVTDALLDVEARPRALTKP